MTDKSIEAAAKADNNKDETAWLVESFSGQRDNYLAGFTCEYMGMGFAYMPKWTADHLQALRLTREVDATALITGLDDAVSKCRAIEHSWMTSRPLAAERSQTREWAAIEKLLPEIPGALLMLRQKSCGPQESDERDWLYADDLLTRLRAAMGNDHV